MLSLLVAMLLAAQPAAPAPPAGPPARASTAEAKTAPLSAEQAVDSNGVPAWAKRKHKQPVQGCETRPGIGIETWRQNYDPQSATGLKPRPPQTTCRR